MNLARFVSLVVFAPIGSLAFFETFVSPAVDNGLGALGFKSAPIVSYPLGVFGFICIPFARDFTWSLRDFDVTYFRRFQRSWGPWVNMEPFVPCALLASLVVLALLASLLPLALLASLVFSPSLRPSLSSTSHCINNATVLGNCIISFLMQAGAQAAEPEGRGTGGGGVRVGGTRLPICCVHGRLCPVNPLWTTFITELDTG